MTFLVLLPAAARAGIVAADLRLVALDLADRVVAAGPRRPRRLRNGRAAPAASNRAEGGRGRGCRGVQRPLRRPARRGPRRRHGGGASLALVGPHHRHQPPQVADDLFLDAIAHRPEELEALLLVLDERIALAVAAQADPFLQVIEAV